jgi:hypothetical protein
MHIRVGLTREAVALDTGPDRHDGLRVRRDPRELVKLLLSAADS